MSVAPLGSLNSDPNLNILPLRSGTDQQTMVLADDGKKLCELSERFHSGHTATNTGTCPIWDNVCYQWLKSFKKIIFLGPDSPENIRSVSL